MAKISRTFRLDKSTLDKLDTIKNEYEKILDEKGFKMDVNNTYVIERLIDEEYKIITNLRKIVLPKR